MIAFFFSPTFNSKRTNFPQNWYIMLWYRCLCNIQNRIYFNYFEKYHTNCSLLFVKHRKINKKKKRMTHPQALCVSFWQNIHPSMQCHETRFQSSWSTRDKGIPNEWKLFDHYGLYAILWLFARRPHHNWNHPKQWQIFSRSGP